MKAIKNPLINYMVSLVIEKVMLGVMLEKWKEEAKK